MSKGKIEINDGEGGTKMVAVEVLGETSYVGESGRKLINVRLPGGQVQAVEPGALEETTMSKGKIEINLSDRLMEYARDTAADMGADVATAIRAMDDEPGEVARNVGCSVVAVQEWIATSGGEVVRCECGEAMGEPCEWTGHASETVVVDWMPEHLRESHRAAGNAGEWPHNGSLRLRVNIECADRLRYVWEDGERTTREDSWVRVLGPA